jgi:hypothetical protein
MASLRANLLGLFGEERLRDAIDHRLQAFEKAMKKKKITVLQLSGVTGEGLQAVVDRIAQTLFAKEPEKVRAKARHDEKPAAKKSAAEPKAVPEGKLTKRKALRSRENPNKGRGAKKLTQGRQRPERKKASKKKTRR